MPPQKLEKPIPTVSRILDDVVVELIYDAPSNTTGLVRGSADGEWTVEGELVAGNERLVPYSPRNNLIANRCVLLPSIPVLSGSAADLIADIRAYLHRYVDLSPLFEQVAAHYILLTWLHDAFSEVPYLRLHGDYGTGKTRALITLGSVCYKPFFAAGASTVSPIFHTLDQFGGTLILDEADFRFSDATTDIVKILNNGTVKGLPVLRTRVTRDREFNPVAYKVFGPKIVAMRGAFSDPALESRFLTEEMGLREVRSDIPVQTPGSLHVEALALRNRLLHFRLCNLKAARIDPAAASTDLEARTNQIALPLLSLISDLTLRSDIHELLKLQQSRVRRARSETAEGRVLAATVGALSNNPFVTVQKITDVFNTVNSGGSDVPITAKRVGMLLRTLRIDTRKSHGNYVVAASELPKLSTLAKRYGVATN